MKRWDSRKSFIRCVSDSEVDSFVVFGRNQVDTVTLVEVSGYLRRRDSVFIAKDWAVIEVFRGIRESAERLAMSQFFCEVAISSVVNFDTMLNSLYLLHSGRDRVALVEFLLSVLEENGVLDVESLSVRERDIIQHPERYSSGDLKCVSGKLLVSLEGYLGSALRTREVVL